MLNAAMMSVDYGANGVGKISQQLPAIRPLDELGAPWPVAFVVNMLAKQRVNVSFFYSKLVKLAGSSQPCLGIIDNFYLARNMRMLKWD